MSVSFGADEKTPHILLLLFFDETLHLCLVCLCLQEEVPLVAGAGEIMLGILALPVVVAREIVPKEAHALHVGEEFGGVGQERYFERSEEALCRFEVAACERLEDVHAEVDLVVLGRVFGDVVSGGRLKDAVVDDAD